MSQFTVKTSKAGKVEYYGPFSNLYALVIASMLRERKGRTAEVLAYKRVRISA
jgi:hypothetical protein